MYCLYQNCKGGFAVETSLQVFTSKAVLIGECGYSPGIAQSARLLNINQATVCQSDYSLSRLHRSCAAFLTFIHI